MLKYFFKACQPDSILRSLQTSLEVREQEDHDVGPQHVHGAVLGGRRQPEARHHVLQQGHSGGPRLDDPILKTRGVFQIFR